MQRSHAPGFPVTVHMAITMMLAVFIMSHSIGCASIINGQTDTITIDSVPSNQSFTLINRDGDVIESGTTPATLTLKRGAGFFKKGKYTANFGGKEFEVKNRLSLWYAGGNLVFGGLIGYLIVDPITGGMWNMPKEQTFELVAPPE